MKKVRLIPVCVFILLLGLVFIGCEKNDNTSSDSNSTPVNSANQEEEKEKQEYARGTSTKTGWESEYLNLRFAVPDGYIMGTEEELQKIMDLGTDIVSSDFNLDKKSLDYAKARVVGEMIATAPGGVPNLNITVEKLALSRMTEEQYLEAVKTQLLSLKEITYSVSDEIVTVDLAGENYKQISATAKRQGQEILQVYLIRKVDDRMVVLVVTYNAKTVAGKDILLKAFKQF